VEGLTWTEARRTCQSQSGGDLVSLSEWDWRTLTMYVLPGWSNKFNNYWHIGLRRDSSRNWTWLKESKWLPINLTSYWQPGQPCPDALYAAMANCPPDTSGSFKGITNDTVAGFVCKVYGIQYCFDSYLCWRYHPVQPTRATTLNASSCVPYQLPSATTTRISAVTSRTTTATTATTATKPVLSSSGCLHRSVGTIPLACEIVVLFCVTAFLV